MYDKRRKHGISAMGMLAMVAGMVPTALIERLPEPKPPKQLTDDDHARIQAAADRRAKRNAKRVAVPAVKKEQEHE